ncbi:hypothetical protein WICPIJ_001816 [Wickerhamomyces pijperi]|uniref:CAP-Gly domain-containing protein n=1 Tax=Wickerhamomyces pijperi TaxID=599730 RepID=A0A9P8QB16_WICPI|nr:hypothetical protein WICPIJ_001816 [Wickerhamomyces pijperi]
MSDYFEIQVTSQQTSSHRRVSPQWTLLYLRERIELFTGIPPQSQQLLHFTNSTSTSPIDLTAKFNSDATTLKDIDLSESSRIHVNDTRPLEEQYHEDEDSTEYFELKDEDYDKLTNSVRHWKRENKLGRFNSDLVQSQSDQLSKEKQLAETLTIGARFRTMDKEGTNERRGVIAYVGAVPQIEESTTWVGVKFDEPVGKNDGSIKGERYFDCQMGYGGFLKPSVVEMGDFEEVDIFGDLSDDDDEI